MDAIVSVSQQPPDPQQLRPWERVLLIVFALVLLAFGLLVEYRAVYQQTSKTDFGVYARAAWAVRTGQDPYAFHVHDNNGWHYCYPLPFAVLLTPLADPPPWEQRTGYLPFAVSIGVWYALNVVFLFLAAHLFARSVLTGESFGSRRWWSARIMPLVIASSGLGYTLARGQSNILVVLLVALSFAALTSDRRLLSGIWLAAAAVLKVFPAYLLLFPILRRDFTALLGWICGSLILLLGVPAAYPTSARAADWGWKVIRVVLAPGLGQGGDQTRAKELTNTTATDSQSFAALIHAWRHPDRFQRPENASVDTKLAHWGIGAVLTAIMAGFVWRRLAVENSPQHNLIILGCLCVLMLLLTPVSHMHYYALAYPLVAGLWLTHLANCPQRTYPQLSTMMGLFAWGLLVALPLLPGEFCAELRDKGLAVFVTLALWAWGLFSIRPADDTIRRSVAQRDGSEISE